MLYSCSKNTVSKIPHISLVAFMPIDSMSISQDTFCYFVFNFTDGDGDIGNDTNSGVYLRDSRFDSAGFVVLRIPASRSPIWFADIAATVSGRRMLFPARVPPFSSA